MMHAPTPPSISCHSLFQEELFKIRPSPSRQFLCRILVSKLCGHTKLMIVSHRTKTVSMSVDQYWLFGFRKSGGPAKMRLWKTFSAGQHKIARSEEHTSELQSPCNLVCRLLLEKKKKKQH